jgi:hypothetical protein
LHQQSLFGRGHVIAVVSDDSGDTRSDGIERLTPLGEGDRVRRLAAVPVADELPVHREHHAGTRPLGVRFAASVHLAEQSAALPLAGFPLKLQLA